MPSNNCFRREFLTVIIMAGRRLHFSAEDVARAVNQLVRFEAEDQEGLLEIIDNYVCPPLECNSNKEQDNPVDNPDN